MHDYYDSKSHEWNLLVTGVYFATPVDIIWLLTQIFVAVVVADKELMICLNKVTAKMTFQENTLSIGIISKQYVYFWKSFMELRWV